MVFTFEGVNEGEKIVLKDLLKMKITKLAELNLEEVEVMLFRISKDFKDGHHLDFLLIILLTKYLSSFHALSVGQ